MSKERDLAPGPGPEGSALDCLDRVRVIARSARHAVAVQRLQRQP
jgi:hypothetical protein